MPLSVNWLNTGLLTYYLLGLEGNFWEFKHFYLWYFWNLEKCAINKYLLTCLCHKWIWCSAILASSLRNSCFRLSITRDFDPLVKFCSTIPIPLLFLQQIKSNSEFCNLKLFAEFLAWNGRSNLYKLFSFVHLSVHTTLQVTKYFASSTTFKYDVNSVI